MKKEIYIDGKAFEYSEVELFHGRKVIDREISKGNLNILNSVLKKTDIIYGLIFGTLLGAIREGNFIEHDEDVDIYVLMEHRLNFLRLLPILKDKGLELVRYENELISLMKDNEYIDIYFFELQKKLFFRNYRVLNNRYVMDAYSLENPEIFSFLDMLIPIPSNSKKLLRKTYGKNWLTPIKNGHAQPNSFIAILKSKIQWMKKIPFFSYTIKKIKHLSQ